MRHASSQAADGMHLLVLAQLILVFFAGGLVNEVSENLDQFPVFAESADSSFSHIHRRPVLTAKFALRILKAAVEGDAAHQVREAVRG